LKIKNNKKKNEKINGIIELLLSVKPNLIGHEINKMITPSNINCIIAEYLLI
jgi:hypothetical protein